MRLQYSKNRVLRGPPHDCAKRDELLLEGSISGVAPATSTLDVAMLSNVAQMVGAEEREQKARRKQSKGGCGSGLPRPVIEKSGVRGACDRLTGAG